jgi:hypothetical protein
MDYMESRIFGWDVVCLPPVTDLIEQVDRIADGRGRGIDREIRPLLLELWRLGIVTDGSCGGHLLADEGRCALPWVWVGDAASRDHERRFLRLASSSRVSGLVVRAVGTFDVYCCAAPGNRDTAFSDDDVRRGRQAFARFTEFLRTQT